jgi:cytochrome b561
MQINALRVAGRKFVFRCADRQFAVTKVRNLIVDSQPGRQGTTATLLGQLLFVIFLILFWNILQVPRTALDERESMRAIHDSVGLLVMLLSAIQIHRFFKLPAPLLPPTLPANSFNYNRLLLLAL